MYTTIIHPIRKALLLSCNEYIVLDQIWRLSKNEKYGNWCVASKNQLAEWLDLSRKTIFRAIDKLLKKELIIRDEKTGWLKTTDEWNEQMANTHDWVLGFKGKQTTYISGKVKSDDPSSVNVTLEMVSKRHSDGVNVTPYNKRTLRMRESALEIFGEEGTIKLTRDEYLKLCKRFGGKAADRYLQKVENWKLAKNEKYDNDYRGILGWFSRAKEEGKFKLDWGDFREEDFLNKEEYEKRINQIPI